MGLRTRWAVLPAPGTARYLRVVGRGGDGYYSVSEVQAFCKRPAVFPPQLKLPPKKYGWDAIDNDVMVNVKGVTAVIAAVLLLAAYFRRFYELRIQSIGWRGFSIGLFALTSLISIWLAGLADTGTAASVTFWASIVKWAREHGANLLYGAAGAAFVAALVLIGVLRAKRTAPVLGAIGATLLTAIAGFGLWAAALNPQSEQVAVVIKWAKDHGSAPGFYYTAALEIAHAYKVNLSMILEFM